MKILEPTRREPRSARAPDAPHSIFHESFTDPDARDEFDPHNVPDINEFADHYMPDEVTRDFARRMHYAAYRWKHAKGVVEARKWKEIYVSLRDEIVLGNRKLIYQAVRRRMAMSNKSEDLIGDCHIVLIQAVAAYNPWLGIRFSTYAYTCLVRALGRLAQRMATDWLAHSASLDLLPEGEPRQKFDANLHDSNLWGIDEYLHADHPLLSMREKLILRRRYGVREGANMLTLAQVGQELGLSKERVRQMQASALGKLRDALLGEPTPIAAS
ncbi:MAG TPA: sigma-70 family RNA polymerase sigma factor [Gemmataceae bacterium]|nr:sigma-70 family RNA polymerase sigma factor [Gemmataceae bacterium]